MADTDQTAKPQAPAPAPARTDALSRFFGGPPLAVIVKLILLSIVVGLVLDLLGLDPRNLLQSLERLVRHLWEMGFDLVRWVWRYLVLGAAVVVPIWLIVRLVRAPRGR